jgi:uncharacterized pyridoxal phosphate-containing UPF0001 family protein
LRKDVLIEVNMGGEDTKAGIAPESAEKTVQACMALPGVRVLGLMTVAPFVENPEDAREVFKKMRQLFLDIREKNYDNGSIQILSMGMTNDYPIAIEEGATMVRVGTGIFGKR